MSHSETHYSGAGCRGTDVLEPGKPQGNRPAMSQQAPGRESDEAWGASPSHGKGSPVSRKRACEQKHYDQGTQTGTWRVRQFVQYSVWKDVWEELYTFLDDCASSSNCCLEGMVGTGLRIKAEF